MFYLSVRLSQHMPKVCALSCLVQMKKCLYLTSCVCWYVYMARNSRWSVTSQMSCGPVKIPISLVRWECWEIGSEIYQWRIWIGYKKAKTTKLCQSCYLCIHSAISLLFSPSCYWRKLCTVMMRTCVRKPCSCCQQHRRKLVFTVTVVFYQVSGYSLWQKFFF